MDFDVFGFHQSYDGLEKRLGQKNEVVNLPPFNVSNFELRVFMIAAVFVEHISQPKCSAKHQKNEIQRVWTSRNGESRVPPDWRHRRASRRCGLALTKAAKDGI